MKNNNGWKKERKENELNLKENYYIFCEGEKTEPNYFNGFKEYIDNNPIYKNMIKIKPCAKDTLRVVNDACQYIKENKITQGNVWCVYDKDDFKADDFDNAYNKINALNDNDSEIKYFSAWSNQCIELWFILHFSYYSSDNDRSTYINYLNTKFKRHKLGKYQKNMSNIFDILLKYGNPKQAIENAKRLIQNASSNSPSKIKPGTNVYALVEKLAKYLPDDIKSKF